MQFTTKSQLQKSSLYYSHILMKQINFIYLLKIRRPNNAKDGKDKQTDRKQTNKQTYRQATDRQIRNTN